MLADSLGNPRFAFTSRHCGHHGGGGLGGRCLSSRRRAPPNAGEEKTLLPTPRHHRRVPSCPLRGGVQGSHRVPGRLCSPRGGLVGKSPAASRGHWGAMALRPTSPGRQPVARSEGFSGLSVFIRKSARLGPVSPKSVPISLSLFLIF